MELLPLPGDFSRLLQLPALPDVKESGKILFAVNGEGSHVAISYSSRQNALQTAENLDGSLIHLFYKSKDEQPSWSVVQVQPFPASGKTRDEGSPSREASGETQLQSHVTCLLFLDLYCPQQNRSEDEKSSHPSLSVLAVGRASGRLEFYSAQSGGLLFSQIFHQVKVTGIVYRGRSSPQTSGHADDVVVMYEGNTIVSINGYSLYVALRSLLAKSSSPSTTAAANPSPTASYEPPLEYRKLFLQDQQGLCAAGYCTAVDPLPLSDATFQSIVRRIRGREQNSPELYAGSESIGDNSSLVLVTGGASPLVALYRVERTPPLSITNLTAAMSGVATKTFSAVMTFAKSWWGGGQEVQAASGEKQESQEEVDAIAQRAQKQKEQTRPGIPQTSSVHVKEADRRRKILAMQIDPTGRYCAATDTLGRVLLLDLASFAIVRMWKGYRDAGVAWVRARSEEECKEGWTATSSGTAKGMVGPTSTFRDREKKKMGKILLAIHAPKRGILELWEPIHGPRLAVMSVSPSTFLCVPPIGAPLGSPSAYFTRDNLMNRTKVFLVDWKSLSCKELRMSVSDTERVSEERKVEQFKQILLFLQKQKRMQEWAWDEEGEYDSEKWRDDENEVGDDGKRGDRVTATGKESGPLAVQKKKLEELRHIFESLELVSTQQKALQMIGDEVDVDYYSSLLSSALLKCGTFIAESRADVCSLDQVQQWFQSRCQLLKAYSLLSLLQSKEGDEAKEKESVKRTMANNVFTGIPEERAPFYLSLASLNISKSIANLTTISVPEIGEDEALRKNASLPFAGKQRGKKESKPLLTPTSSVSRRGRKRGRGNESGSVLEKAIDVPSHHPTYSTFISAFSIHSPVQMAACHSCRSRAGESKLEHHRMNFSEDAALAVLTHSLCPSIDEKTLSSVTAFMFASMQFASVRSSGGQDQWTARKKSYKKALNYLSLCSESSMRLLYNTLLRESFPSLFGLCCPSSQNDGKSLSGTGSAVIEGDVEEAVDTSVKKQGSDVELNIDGRGMDNNLWVEWLSSLLSEQSLSQSLYTLCCESVRLPVITLFADFCSNLLLHHGSSETWTRWWVLWRKGLNALYVYSILSEKQRQQFALSASSLYTTHTLPHLLAKAELGHWSCFEDISTIVNQFQECGIEIYDHSDICPVGSPFNKAIYASLLLKNSKSPALLWELPSLDTFDNALLQQSVNLPPLLRVSVADLTLLHRTWQKCFYRFNDCHETILLFDAIAELEKLSSLFLKERFLIHIWNRVFRTRIWLLSDLLSRRRRPLRSKALQHSTGMDQEELLLFLDAALDICARLRTTANRDVVKHQLHHESSSSSSSSSPPTTNMSSTSSISQEGCSRPSSSARPMCISDSLARAVLKGEGITRRDIPVLHDLSGLMHVVRALLIHNIHLPCTLPTLFPRCGVKTLLQLPVNDGAADGDDGGIGDRVGEDEDEDARVAATVYQQQVLDQVRKVSAAAANQLAFVFSDGDYSNV